MSKIYQKESQLIIRFPPEIAQKLRSFFDLSKKQVLETKLHSSEPAAQASQSQTAATSQQLPSNQQAQEPAEKQREGPEAPQITIFPKIVKETESNAEKVQFDIQVDDFLSKGSLIELPCMLETFKTEDTINIFKSNDTKQMIYVHKEGEEEVPNSLASKKIVIDEETNEKVVRYESHHGLTPPTYYIKKRFYRKKPIFDKAEVEEVEKIMVKIQKEITKNDKEPERKRRKYTKRY